jgi:subtilisin-like proprotein convertase family protein
MALFARLMVIATALLGVASVAPGQAAAALTGSPTVVETPNDGVIGPGDHLAITVRVSSSDPVTNVRGTLETTTPGVTVSQSNASYGDIAAGASATNADPFVVNVGSTLLCGTTLNFKLRLTSGDNTVDAADVPFTVDTGHGATALTDYDGGPVAIGFRGTLLRPQLRLAALNFPAPASVAAPGIIRSVQVNIGHLTHENIRDLTLTLVDPNNARVTLVNHRGAPNQDFTNTELSGLAGTPLPASDAHYTGTFLPDGDLGTLVDRNPNGTWRLEINEADPNEVGHLDDWTLRIATADCSARSFADLRFDPADRVNPGTTVMLDGSDSVSVNGPISQYDWDFGDGMFTESTSADSVPHLFLRHGNYTVRLRLHDAAGITSPVTKHLIVSEEPKAVISNVGFPKQGVNVTLDGSTSSDPEDGLNLAKYEWDLDYDGSDFTPDKSGARPIVQFATPGAHRIALRVTDSDGATGTASETFDVPPTFAPTPVVTATPNPVVAGALVSFDASGSTDDGRIVAYDWDLDGNGTYETTGTSPAAARSYPNAGVISVGLRLTDDDGRFTVTHLAVLVRGAGGAGGGSGPGSPGATSGRRTPTGGMGAAGGAAGGAGGGAAGGPAQGELAASLAGSSIQKLKLITKKGLSLSCRADRAATCSVTAMLPAAKARSLGLSKSRKKAFALGRASVRLRKAGTATITVRVSKRVLAKLRRVSKVSVLVTGNAADSGGGRAVLRRVVLLRR